MTAMQATFDFTAPPAPPLPGEVEELVRFLDNNPGFHKAKDIGEFMHLSDRKIRQLAEAADGLIVSGPGSPGYCHLHHCDDETTGHITDTLISQGKHMIRRAFRIKRLARQQAIRRIH